MTALTKQQAVAALIDGAMRAFQCKDEVCAVVLAGAAEDAMPRSVEPARLDTMREVFAVYDGGKDAAIERLNRQRNWLKHNNSTQPGSMTFDQAIVLIVRAYNRYINAYGLDQDTKDMRAFWHGARVLEPER